MATSEVLNLSLEKLLGREFTISSIRVAVA